MEITLCDIWIMTEDISIREPGEITRLQSVSIMAVQRLICGSIWERAACFCVNPMKPESLEVWDM